MSRSSIAFPGHGRSEEPEWTVWVAILICLVLGWAISQNITNRNEIHSDVAGGSVTIPAYWIKTSEDGAVFAATDLRGGSYGSRVSVRTAPKADLLPTSVTPAEAPPADADMLSSAATNWSLIRGQDLEGYRILEITETTVGERPAVSIEYAYLTDPPQAVGTGAMPGLMHAIDTVVASGDQFAILTVAVEAGDDDQLTDLNNRILSNWQVP
jgi:hypothetical protein